jgi:hypothetical protein
MKETTKELADSVGAVYPVLFMGRSDGVLFTETELETFVALVAAAEREECAKLCETLEAVCYDTAGYTDCAAAIRARGNRT